MLRDLRPRRAPALLLLLAACGPSKGPLDTESAGSSSGDPTGGSMTSTSATSVTDTGEADHGVCDEYLACLGAVSPDMLPPAEASYGPSGSCWQGAPELAEVCREACAMGLATFQSLFPDAPACGGSGTTTDTTLTTSEGTTTTTTAGSSSTTEGGFCQDLPDQPQDAACTDPSGCGCASGACFAVPALGGLCGECLLDADCPGGGCTSPNPVAGKGALCNEGGAGDGCQSDAVCEDPGAPHCTEVLLVPGIIEVSTCGECATDADCTPAEPICTPVYDLLNFTGQFVCKAKGSVPNSEGCSLAPGGDAACASGRCGEASVVGLLTLGICGECESDAECGGKFCSTPQADLVSGQLFGAVCM